jgi:TolB-like protein/Tfp pilus assembly protein PilF
VPDASEERKNDRSASSAVDPASKVFISYASQDSAVAEQLCAALEAANLPCWIAPRDVRAGESYAAAIIHAINSSRMLLLVLSQNAIKSSHVLREVERASSKSRPILSVRIDATALPPELEYFLSANQWLDASTGPLELIFPALVESVRNHTAGEAEHVRNAAGALGAAAAGTPAVKREPSSHWGKRATAVALTALVAGLVYLLLDKFWFSNPAATQNPAAQTMPATPAAPAIAEKSIAVLPFVDMSEKKDQEYFSDGLSEELIDLLTQIPDLRVPARTSSFYFKGKSEDIQTIAKRLLVANVLEGSVRKSGDHLRVTAQLIRAANGYNLWSTTYDRQFDDVFKLQDEIAGAVVGALKLKLLAPPTLSNRQTTNPEAYNQYLIGRYLFAGGDWNVDRKAAAAFQAAVDLDPNYALAWAGLAEARFEAAEVSPSVARLISERREAQSLVDKAIALQPDLADGYAARGRMRAWGQWDFQGAADDFRHALALEPENGEILIRYSQAVLLPRGRLDEAVAVAQKALKVDPLNGAFWRHLGVLLLFRGDPTAGAVALQRSLDIYPEQSNTAAFLAYALLLQGQPANALLMSQRATAEPFRLQGAALAEHDLGRTTEAQRHLNELIARSSADAAYQIAEVYAWIGDKDLAFQWLDTAYRQHDGGLTIVKADPLLRSLRSDPRFTALLQKMGLLE